METVLLRWLPGWPIRNFILFPPGKAAHFLTIMCRIETQSLNA